ncbi:hypothetical protein GALMADRAFT_235764 [Galerina marginata CBS 339.88]|uniref:Uncharacterized protein n=1 Tax=Galerina marginata (strain CBS 339.88) TaxID=685588 RepID=A0A067TK87_GALM3|nr:hypothetical protein GALMADRAFT_235764 [Galerina marginata CBS 339.88]
MSSISFPNSHRPTDSHHEDQFYTPSFDTSSFQMNPLSSHPPRTPRTSMHASSSNHYSASVYDAKEEIEEPVDAEDIEIDHEEDRVKVAETRIREEEVWREMFVTSNGRDKAFKLIQYSIRVGLVFHRSLTSTRLLRRPTRPPWEENIIQRLTSTASGLSTTRKLLLLFNWLHPLTQILAQQSVPFSAEVSTEKAKKVQKPFLHTILYAPPPVLLELVHAVADDIATWARLGLLGKKIGTRAERFSDWCWLLATLVGLVENSVERQMIGSLQAGVEGRLYTESMSGATAKSKPKTSKLDEKELSRLRNQDYWLQVTRTKLLMDLIFVSYELFNLQRGRDAVKAFTGLTAAVLSSAKLFDRHKSALLKTLLTSTS